MDLDVRKPLLTWKGVLFFIFVGLAMLIVQSTVGPMLKLNGYLPDLLLIMAIYTGLHTPATSGALIVTGLGLLRDAAGGGVFGFHAALFLAVFATANLTRQRLDPAAPYYQALITLVFSLAAGMITLIGLNFFGWPFRVEPRTWSSPTAVYLVSAVLTAIFGPVLYWALERFRPDSNAKADGEI